MRYVLSTWYMYNYVIVRSNCETDKQPVTDSSCQSFKTPSKAPLTSSTSDCVANASHVTHREHLDRLASLYVAFINGQCLMFSLQDCTQGILLM